MADEDTIKEFLVSLGFKTDEASQKKFADSIGLATAKFTTLANLATKVAEHVAGEIKGFFTQLEQFYFQAGETNSTVAGLKSVELAAEHMGLGAQAGLQAVEGLATFLRHNPAGEQFLRGFGVQTRDANGALLKTEELLIGVGRQLGKLPAYRANLYGQVLGLDEKTLLRMRSGEFEKHFRDAQKLLGGANLDRAAEQWRGLVEGARSFGEQLEVLGIRGASALLDKLGPVFDQISSSFKESGLADDLESMLQTVLSLGGKLADAFGPALQHSLAAVVSTVDLLVNSIRIIADLLQGDLTKAGEDAQRITAAGSKTMEAALGALVGVGNVGLGIGDAVLGTHLAPTHQETRQATLNQRTTINVQGGDPHQTASAVASQQERVNQSGIRNLAKGTP